MQQKREKSYVSAQTVAERAGVSRSAVSRTFTDGASVSETTRRKVLDAAQELGYHVNQLARGLISEQSNIVSLVAADLGSPFQSRMIELLTYRLQAHNKVAMVINTAGDQESVERALRQTLHYRADATIILSGTPPSSLIDTCLANGQYLVLVNRSEQIKNIDRVSADNESGAREAFQLLKRAGCTRMSVISSEAGTPSLVAREKAFAKAAQQARIPVQIIRAGPTAYQTGVEAARQLLSRAERPDAAFCVTDLLALGFMDAARNEFGISIPRELCVMGFDDIEQASWEAYGLTTIKQAVERMTDRIIELVLQRGEAPRLHAPEVFDVRPVWRRSVRSG